MRGGLGMALPEGRKRADGFLKVAPPQGEGLLFPGAATTPVRTYRPVSSYLFKAQCFRYGPNERGSEGQWGYLCVHGPPALATSAWANGRAAKDEEHVRQMRKCLTSFMLTAPLSSVVRYLALPGGKCFELLRWIAKEAKL